MGIIDIRWRNERLGNIGEVTPVRGLNGAVEAARSWGEAVKGLAGNVADGIGSAAKGFSAWLDAKDKTDRDNFMADLQNGYNAYMNGDGSEENPGKMNEQPGDVAMWGDEARDKYDEMVAELRERHHIGDRQWAMVSRDAAAFRNQWNGRIAGRVATTERKNAQDAATARRTATEATLAAGDCPREVYERYWRECSDELDAYGITDPDARAGEMRKRGLGVCRQGVANFVGGLSQMADEDERGGADGAAVFDRAVEDLKAGNAGAMFFPQQALEVGEDGERGANLVERMVNGADMETFRKAAIEDVKTAKAKWERGRDAANAERRRAEAQAEADEMDAVNQRLMAVHGEAVPETKGGEAAHAERLAAAYESEAANERLTPERRLSYAKTAESLRASLREDRRRARADEDARLEKRRAATARIAAASFKMGRYYDPETETWVRMSATEMNDRARALLNSGAITAEQFYKVTDATQGAETVESKGLLDAFLSAAKAVAPDALVYNARTRQYEVNVSDKVKRGTKIPDSKELPDEWTVAGEKGFFGGDPTQAATYADLADALNAARAWQKASNATEDEAVARFLKMASGTVENASMRTIKAKTEGEMEEAQLIESNRRNALRYRARGANGSAFGR